MKKHEAYEFTLVLAGVDDKTKGLEDTLFDAGCDDALINFRNGTVYLDFCRKAASLEAAVISAIKAVEESGIGAKVISILPDNFVSESEIAKRLNKNRQIVSLWIKKERRQKNPFPHPVFKLSDKSPLWRWHEVVKWLSLHQLIKDKKIVTAAMFFESINVVLEERDSDIRRYRRAILKELQAGDQFRGNHHN